MRHRDARRRLTQKPHHARLLQRNLVTSLLLYEAVRTTKSRARSIQGIVDRLIVSAKKQQDHQAVRMLNAYLMDKNACRKVMEVFKDRYKTRTSGFTSMKAVGSRKGDGAEMVDLTLMDADVGRATAKVDEKSPTKPKKPASPTNASSKQ